MMTHFLHLAELPLLLLQGVAVCTATCAQLHKRAEKITATLMERGGLNTGDNVVLLYPPGELTHSHAPCRHGWPSY